MKLRTVLKLRKLYNKLKFKSHKLLFKRMFHVELYNEILDELANNDVMSVRYYMNSYTNTDKSINHKLQEYHKRYKTEYNAKLLKEGFMFTEAYVRYKLASYDDINFIYGEDENGTYFEIVLKN